MTDVIVVCCFVDVSLLMVWFSHATAVNLKAETLQKCHCSPTGYCGIFYSLFLNPIMSTREKIYLALPYTIQSQIWYLDFFIFVISTISENTSIKVRSKNIY